MQNTLFDILILGLLVLLFAVIYRKRATSRLRFWIAGWLFTLAHFALLLPHSATGFWQAMQFSLCMNALVMAGICFALASSTLGLKRENLMLMTVLISMPALAYVFFTFFGFSAILPLAGLVIAGEAVVIWTTLRFTRGNLFVVWAIAAAAVVCGGWLLCLIGLRQADIGVYAILTQLFFVNAVLFWNDFPRVSAGVVTSSLGLLAWAAVFPTALAVAHFFPHLNVPGQLWNVPKYFVEFGMILTLLENQIYSANWQSEQNRMLFDSNPHPMFLYDAKTFAFFKVNDAAIQQYGYGREEFLKMTMSDLHEWAALPGIERVLSDAQSAIKVTGPWPHRRKDGSKFEAEMSTHSIDFDGHDARFSMVQDVTERQRLHDQLVHRAHHDSLTNLPNRFLLEQRMRHTLENASRYNHKAAVLCIDLDRFKQVNDNYGHATGDACLQEVAARLMSRLRESDTAARTGGEEFTVVIGELLYKVDAEKVARDLLTSFQRPFKVGDIILELSASIGIAVYPDHGTEGSYLWRAADLAMYHAKFSGGNQYAVVSSDTEYALSESKLRSIRKIR